MKWINRLYIIFLGIILTLTTGFGVAAFYPEPKSPDYPINQTYPIVPQSCYSTPDASKTPDCQKYFDSQSRLSQDQTAQQKQYDQAMAQYRNKNSGYTRTAIFFGVVIGAIFIMMGITLIKKSQLISNGILFAGVLTAVLTRILIAVASLGSSVTGTDGANTISYVEFGVLAILSIAVIAVGLTTLKDEVKK